MGISQVAFVNGRALSSALWVMSAWGWETSSFGTLESAPRAAIARPTGSAFSEAASWVAEYGLSPPGDVERLHSGSPGVAERPDLARGLRGLEPHLDAWLREIWPTDDVVEPAAIEMLAWILGLGARRRATSELYLLVPVIEPVTRRVGDSEWIVSRALLNDSDAFRAWFKSRTRLPVTKLASAFVDADA